MIKRKKLVERRKHTRFHAKDGALALLTSGSAKLGQIIDISVGGLAFCYIADEERSNGSFELGLFFSDNGFYLDGVRFEIISDFEIGDEVPLNSITMRRCGVQFAKLTHNQISQLEYFIQNYTLHH
ncbi:MAG: PilZ domain-containing protein [Desulfobacterales bacterium]|nr:PilZ domain-containing protein [Desulfobacterales bacterium]